jgi:hypothetical protein
MPQRRVRQQIRRWRRRRAQVRMNERHGAFNDMERIRPLPSS